MSMWPWKWQFRYSDSPGFPREPTEAWRERDQFSLRYSREQNHLLKIIFNNFIVDVRIARHDGYGCHYREQISDHLARLKRFLHADFIRGTIICSWKI